METKNLGLVKGLFKQTIPPTRTDVLWYDTLNNILKIYNASTMKWTPVEGKQIVASVTDNAPTSEEIDSAVGMTAVEAGEGFKTTIKDSDGSQLLYKIGSDGSDWFFITMTKAV